VHPWSALTSVACPGLLIVTFGYLTTCAVWPFRNCRKCGGTGRFRSPMGRAWRPCRRCKGTGARIRLGRHIWNYLRRLHRDGTR
jgi:DnaJ-class molecular chaperone